LTARGPDDLENRLGSLRERQAELAANGADDAQMRTVAREIAAVARRLGFDADEAAAIAGQVDAPASGPAHAMAGEYRVLRGSADPILTFSALAIAAVVIGLGQPVAGAVIIVAALASWVVRGAMRVARLDIDVSGGLSFPGRLDRFDPSELVGIDFAYRYPFAVAEHNKAASETVDLRLRLSRNRSVRLARGPLWRISPRRAPVAYSRLERHLSAQAREAGLTIERSGAGWTARRV
jgi:hypothetical protein